MNRVRTIAVVVMSLLAGGVVFEVGRGQADPWNQAPPAPPVPGPARPGKAPRAPAAGGGVSISVHGGKIQISGLDQLVATHLQNVRDMLANNPRIPKDVRDRITARMDRVKGIVDKNIKRLDTSDLDKLDDQLEQMGEELDKALDGLDQDLAKLGDTLGQDLAKDIQKNLKDLKFKFGPDPAPPGPPAPPSPPDDPDVDDDSDKDDDLPGASADVSDDDMHAAVDQLKNFALRPAQKDAIAKLRGEADVRVETERKALELASQQLETALADVNVTPAIVEGYVDRITRHEAEIRKARLLTWVKARNVLDPDQRKQLESAMHRVK